MKWCVSDAGTRRGTRWELSVVTWFPWDPVVLGEADGLGEIGSQGPPEVKEHLTGSEGRRWSE